MQLKLGLTISMIIFMAFEISRLYYIGGIIFL